MKRVLGIFGLALMLVSCEKELDFHYHEVESQLVIEGLTSCAGTSVSLTKTIPMDEPMDTKSVTDAKILLTDLTDGLDREVFVDKNGVFYDAVPGIVGHDYRIDVFYKGNQYTSMCTMLPPTQIINLQFQWIKMPYDYVAVLQITFYDLDSKDDCYWIKLYRNGQPYMWLLSDDRSAVNGIINEVTMTSRKDVNEEDEKSVLKDGDEIKVTIAPITRNMYDYLIAIQSDSNGPKMFAGDYCLGYYMASNETESSIIYHPDSMSIFH